MIDRKKRGSTDLKEDRSRDFNRLQSLSGKTVDVAASCSRCLLHLQEAKVCCSRYRLSGVSCADNSDQIIHSAILDNLL